LHDLPRIFQAPGLKYHPLFAKGGVTVVPDELCDLRLPSEIDFYLELLMTFAGITGTREGTRKVFFALTITNVITHKYIYFHLTFF
jgi:hypothetical protein